MLCMWFNFLKLCTHFCFYTQIYFDSVLTPYLSDIAQMEREKRERQRGRQMTERQTTSSVWVHKHRNSCASKSTSQFLQGYKCWRSGLLISHDGENDLCKFSQFIIMMKWITPCMLLIIFSLSETKQSPLSGSRWHKKFSLQTSAC